MTEQEEVISTRKLVTVRVIKDLLPIEGADRVEIAQVDGWQCVVGKGEFKKGDFCLYFEVDSLLPVDDSRFEFLRKSSYKKFDDGSEAYRLKTMRFKGAISQGLALPLDKFPEISNNTIATTIDYSSNLRVKKYEPPVPAMLGGDVKGLFPSYIIQKTNQERIQNFKESYWIENRDVEYEASEKINGSSMTAYLFEDHFGVCSHNLELKPPDEGKEGSEKTITITLPTGETKTIIKTYKKNSFWSIAQELKLEESLRKIGRNIAIQGELAGEGIQKNRLGLKGHHLFVFDIFDIDNKRLMLPEERINFVLQIPQLAHVPIIEGLNFPLRLSLEDLLKAANGNSLVGNKTMREGLVFKSKVLIKGQITSFKVLSNEYLLKHSE